MKTNEAFYDDVSQFYNEMINMDEALIQRQKALSNFVQDSMSTAADIGCGTGMDSIAMANLGLKVTAFDQSAQMLQKAKQAAGLRNANIEFVKASADNIPGVYNDKFSLVVSLGNTLANVNGEQLQAALKTCYRLLCAGGTMLIQVLNFSKIINEKERIVNITERGGYWYIRFYDFREDGLNFNILKFNKEKPAERHLVTTSLYPHTYQNMSEWLNDAGFEVIKLWENFNRKLFEPASSKDLIIEAVKSN